MLAVAAVLTFAASALGDQTAASGSPASPAAASAPASPAAGARAECRAVTYTPPTAAEAERATLCVPGRARSGIGVVLVHGGAGTGGSPLDLDGWRRAFLAAGHVTLTIEYRLVRPGADRDLFPRQEQNVKAALQFLRVSSMVFGTNPEHVVVFGVSHGAYLAGVAATTGDDPAFGGPELWPGISDRADATVALYGYYGGWTFYPAELFGPSPAAQEAGRQRLSAVAHAATAAGPVLLVHGRDDHLIAVEESRSFATALRGAGRAVDLWEYDHADHGFDVVVSADVRPDPLTTRGARLAERVDAWLARHL
jgi:acetyl esterase/lipase